MISSHAKPAEPVLYITALVAGSGFHKPSMSGGDRIALNLAKHWAASVGKVVILTTLSGKQMFENGKEHDVRYVVLDNYLSRRRNLWAVLAFEARALVKGITGSISQKVSVAPSVVYAPSHFWPDVLAAIIMSRKVGDHGLIGTLYLFPPSPFSRASPYKGRNFLNGVLYYLSQMGVITLYRRFAKMIWVTNDYDKRSMCRALNSQKIPVLAVKGGIDWPAQSISENSRKEFDGVFIGRLHPQKGVDLLIDVWKLAIKQRPGLKLAIIGDGPLERKIHEDIKRSGLQSNVIMFGFLDGEPKYSVIHRSKVVFYMSTLEIVAMAPIEAMALGLPCVALNIPGRSRYFDKGTCLTQPGSPQEAVVEFFKLMDDPIFYARLSGEAVSLAEDWRWDSRGRALVGEAQKLLSKNG